MQSEDIAVDQSNKGFFSWKEKILFENVSVVSLSGPRVLKMS